AYNTLLNYLNLYSREHHPVITLTLRYPHSFPSFPQLFVIPAKAGIQDSGPEKPFYPISFRTDRPGFPPARE
ncbi:TPA: hypothetical protein ACMZLF_002230, partial [Neisseria gonorrhoeae]